MVDLNSLEREAEKLRAQNEVLAKDNKELKKELDKKKRMRISHILNQEKDNLLLLVEKIIIIDMGEEEVIVRI